MGFCKTISGIVAGAAMAAVCGAALAEGPASCRGNPSALGVSRTITVSAKNYARLGLMQYRYSLPLNDREVVLTFDDGPIPPYTDRVLDILAYHCTKATFFMVGQQAAAHPDAVWRVFAAGHTIGNHSQNHVIHFDHISEKRAEAEIDNGNKTLAAILGRLNGIAPFFRVPGLGRTSEVERYAQSRALVVWSADTVADDWTRITAHQVLERALARLEQRGKGILLLHDIQPRTVLMLPSLLAELKRRNFHIVHVVPEQGPGEPVAEGQLVAARAAAKLGWPRLASASGTAPMTAKFIERTIASEPAGRRYVHKPKGRTKAETASLTFETVGSILSDPPAQPHERKKHERKKKVRRAAQPPAFTAAVADFTRFEPLP